MSARVYDLFVVAGTSACTAGTWMNWGTGWGLIVGGALMLTLTLAGAVLAGRG